MSSSPAAPVPPSSAQRAGKASDDLASVPRDSTARLEGRPPLRPTDERPQAIVVTGAAGGIGSAVTTRLAAHSHQHGGATILAVDINPAPRNGTRADASLRNGPDSTTVEHHVLDVTAPDEVNDFFDALARRYRLRAVVHTAGVLANGPAVETPPDRARAVLTVNALGTINVCTAAARLMCGQRPGDIPPNVRSLTTVASNSALRPRSHLAVYSASKAAASQFTRSLGLELGPSGIRCNVVNPGTTLTPMLRSMWDGEDRTAQTVRGLPRLFQTGVPLGRLASAQDVAGVVEFLVSPMARHITVAALAVDGGASQR